MGKRPAGVWREKAGQGPVQNSWPRIDVEEGGGEESWGAEEEGFPPLTAKSGKGDF